MCFVGSLRHRNTTKLRLVINPNPWRIHGTNGIFAWLSQWLPFKLLGVAYLPSKARVTKQSTLATVTVNPLVAAPSVHSGVTPSVHTLAFSQASGSTSDFVTEVITAMTNLVDHFSTTSSAKLQRIDVQKAMLACNHLSRQCNKSLEDIDAFHMPPPKVSATTAGKRIQFKMPPAHPGVSEVKRPRLAQDGPDDNPNLAEGQHSWSCNLCDFQVSVTVREQLYHRRNKHIHKVQSVATSLPIIEASDSPALTKALTCAKCNRQ